MNFAIGEKLPELYECYVFSVFTVQCWTICRRCIALQLAASNAFPLYLHGGLSETVHSGHGGATHEVI